MQWNVLGHEWAAQLLERHIARQEARHAYLFCGSPGVGRRTLALRFAQALNCTQPQQPGQPCGTCRQCVQIERMQHPDLSVLQADAVGGTLKIEQVRDVQRVLSLAPYQARKRVALLLRFHEASPGAQNALLKTLEEAPQNAVLLLTADAPESLLPTIVSRCEVLRLRPLGLEALAQALHTRWQVPAAQAQVLAHLCGGRVGCALHLLANPDELEQAQVWLDDLHSLVRTSRRERFSYAEAAVREKDKEKLRRMLQVWLTYWRDVLLCCAGAAAPLTNLQQETYIRRAAGQVSLAQARTLVQHLERGLLRLDANINPRLLVEVILLDWPRLA